MFEQLGVEPGVLEFSRHVRTQTWRLAARGHTGTRQASTRVKDTQKSSKEQKITKVAKTRIHSFHALAWKSEERRGGGRVWFFQ